MVRTTATTQIASYLGKLLLAVSIDPGEIGRRLKAARERKLWTQLDFALAANVSPSTVQRWEAGKLPRVRELMRVGELLGIDAADLVEQEPAPQDEDLVERLDRIEQVQEQTTALLRELLARGGEAENPGRPQLSSEDEGEAS